MKFSALQIGIIISMLSVILSCKQDISDLFPPIVNVNYKACHDQETWNTDNVREALTGQWLLVYRLCPFSAESSGPIENQQIIVEFNADSTLNLYEQGQLLETSAWQVVDAGMNYFSLDVSPMVFEVYGGLYICGDLMQCYAADVDLCNHYCRRQ